MTTPKTPRKHAGIEVRTAKRTGETRYRAEVWNPATKERDFKTFPSLAAAKSWRAAMQVRIANGEAGVIESPTLNQAWAAWFVLAQAGTIRNNRGDVYKPSALTGYEHAMRLHVLPELGQRRLADIRVPHVQRLVDGLVARGQAARTVNNTLAPLRVVFKDALRREQCRFNPTLGVAMPSGERHRDRIASPAEAQQLLAAVPDEDRVIWAIAFYAGLRAGEIMALRWEDIDLKTRTLRVERSYDPKSHTFVTPKTSKGFRAVPFPAVLVPYLPEPRAGLVCGDDGVKPYVSTTTRKRALRAWGWKPDPKDPKKLIKARPDALEPITPHECRHTYASLMLAAGIDIVKVSKWMGHSSIQITVDRYGHLLPGDATAAMERFERYLTATHEEPVHV